MELFEKIGDAASKTYKYTAEKTSKIAKSTKIKMQINEHKRNIEDIYVEIGEAVYESFVRDKEIDMKYVQERCEEIKDLSDKIINCKDEILKLNERKQCKNCYEEIDISAKYCPNCGCEQEIEQEEEKEESKQEENVNTSESQENDEEEDSKPNETENDEEE